MKFLSVLFLFFAISTANAGITYELFAAQPKAEPPKANRLLVITEPTWCRPCKQLDPVLKKLKKQGYDVHEYTQAQWFKAKGKPAKVPETVIKEGRQPRIPTLLFVKVNKKTNEVVQWKRGWLPEKGDNEAYIKRRLTK